MASSALKSWGRGLPAVPGPCISHDTGLVMMTSPAWAARAAHVSPAEGGSRGSAQLGAPSGSRTVCGGRLLVSGS